jgi:hypothetical protein
MVRGQIGVEKQNNKEPRYDAKKIDQICDHVVLFQIKYEFTSLSNIVVGEYLHLTACYIFLDT